MDLCVVLGAVSNGRSSSRKINIKLHPTFITPSWFSAPLVLILPLNQNAAEMNICIVQVTDIERLVQNARFPCEDRDDPMQDILPTAAQLYDVAVSEF